LTYILTRALTKIYAEGVASPPQECAKDPHFPGCDQSRDGWLLLNTAVVVDSDGRLIQKHLGSGKSSVKWWNMYMFFWS